MSWATDSRIRIAEVLGYAINGAAMIPIDQAMRTLRELPVPQSQQSIDFIENLLDQWQAINQTAIAIGSNPKNSGLIKLDVIGWSDRANAKSEESLRLRDEIALRIANALGINFKRLGNAATCTGRTRS